MESNHRSRIFSPAHQPCMSSAHMYGGKYWSRTSLRRVAAAYIAVLTTSHMYGGNAEDRTQTRSATNCCTSHYTTHPILAPCTGFEPAKTFVPTVFKTAPSPPGHTAYIWSGGWDSNPLSQRQRVYSPSRLSNFGAPRYVWQAVKDSNPNQAGWSRVCYRYTNDLYMWRGGRDSNPRARLTDLTV